MKKKKMLRMLIAAIDDTNKQFKNVEPSATEWASHLAYRLSTRLDKKAKKTDTPSSTTP